MMVYRFTRSAKEYTKEDQEILAQIPEQYHPRIRSVGRRIVAYAAAGVGIVVVGVPVIAPIIVMITAGIPAKDAMFRGIMLLCFAPLTFFFGIFWGASFGVAMTPAWYLRSPLGARWRELCGASSVNACRAISYVVFVVGLGVIAMLVWLVRSMAPFR